MQTGVLKLALELLDQLSYWANYKIYLGGPDHLALPLALVCFLALSLLVLIAYSLRERYRKN